MHIVSRQTLKRFWEAHADSKEDLQAWFKEAEHAHWSSTVPIKQRYPSASILPGNRVVFNIKGNDYRLVVKIHFNTEYVFIRYVGTHAEYDKIDAETI